MKKKVVRKKVVHKRAVSKKKPDVQVMVEGDHRVSLLFPKGTDLKVKRNVSLDDLVKVLRAPAPKKGEVVGQQCELTAIGSVRG